MAARFNGQNRTPLRDATHDVTSSPSPNLAVATLSRQPFTRWTPWPTRQTSSCCRPGRLKAGSPSPRELSKIEKGGGFAYIPSSFFRLLEGSTGRPMCLLVLHCCFEQRPLLYSSIGSEELAEGPTASPCLLSLQPPTLSSCGWRGPGTPIIVSSGSKGVV